MALTRNKFTFIKNHYRKVDASEIDMDIIDSIVNSIEKIQEAVAALLVLDGEFTVDQINPKNIFIRKDAVFIAYDINEGFIHEQGALAIKRIIQMILVIEHYNHKNKP